MNDAPRIHQRDGQAYVALQHRVTMAGFSAEIDAGFPALFDWLGRNGVAPAGAPFIRYLLIDMAGFLEIQLCVPIAQGDTARVEANERIRTDVVPAGRYATLLHVGHYDGLVAANGALQEWAAEQQLAWDVAHSVDGERWGARIETYTTNPAEEPDQSKWEVEISYRLAD